MNLGGTDIFDSPLPGEDHARVKEAVLAGDSPQGNARCAQLTCREAACNVVCEHRPWTSCVPGTFFAEPPAKPRSTQVFKTRGHGGAVSASSTAVGASTSHSAGSRASGPLTSARTCPHLHLPTLAYTCPHPLTPTHTHTCPHLHLLTLPSH